MPGVISMRAVNFSVSAIFPTSDARTGFASTIRATFCFVIFTGNVGVGLCSEPPPMGIDVLGKWIQPHIISFGLVPLHIW